jgi:hypothetical protein
MKAKASKFTDLCGGLVLALLLAGSSAASANAQQTRKQP